jgi:hypothetical protein
MFLVCSILQILKKLLVSVHIVITRRRRSVARNENDKIEIKVFKSTFYLRFLWWDCLFKPMMKMRVCPISIYLLPLYEVPLSSRFLCAPICGIVWPQSLLKRFGRKGITKLGENITHTHTVLIYTHIYVYLLLFHKSDAVRTVLAEITEVFKITLK